jgi:Transposase
MKVLIGVDPHKESVALAAVDEATSELVELASFLQSRVGLRSLERWARRFPERHWAVENAGGLGRHLAVRLAMVGASVVDVPPKLSARVRVLSSFAGNARKNDGVDALATALAASRNERLAQVDPESSSEALRLLSERRSLTWLQSVPGRSRQPPRAPAGPPPWRGGREALGRQGSAQDARHTSQGRFRPPTPAAGFGGAARRQDAGQKDRRPERAHRSRGGSLGHYPHRDLRRRTHPGRQDHRDCRRGGALPYQSPFRLLLRNGAA